MIEMDVLEVQRNYCLLLTVETNKLHPNRNIVIYCINREGDIVFEYRIMRLN